jgi:Pyridoxal-phosphate dependent enzyme
VITARSSAGTGVGNAGTWAGEVVINGNCKIFRVVAVEPAGAAVRSGRPAGQHQMPGIGVGFVPAVLNRAVIDEIAVVTDDEAFDCARQLARKEGILAGVSSGVAVCEALAVAARPESDGKTIVVMLPDMGGEVHLTLYLTFIPLADTPVTVYPGREPYWNDLVRAIEVALALALSQVSYQAIGQFLADALAVGPAWELASDSSPAVAWSGAGEVRGFPGRPRLTPGSPACWRGPHSPPAV